VAAKELKLELMTASNHGNGLMGVLLADGLETRPGVSRKQGPVVWSRASIFAWLEG
jgi:hypothetical protein